MKDFQKFDVFEASNASAPRNGKILKKIFKSQSKQVLMFLT